MNNENKIRIKCTIEKEEQEGAYSIKIINRQYDTMIEALAITDYDSESESTYFTGAFEILNTQLDNEYTLRILNDSFNDSNVDIYISRDDALDMIIKNKYYDHSSSDEDDYYMEYSTFDDQDEGFVSIYELDNDDLSEVINAEFHGNIIDGDDE